MPFTIGGDWVSKPEKKKISSKPVKVREVKRGKALLTVVFNLLKSEKELKSIAATIKRRLGTGGSIREGNIEIQGYHAAAVKKILDELDIKPQ